MKCQVCSRTIKNPRGATKETRQCYRCRIKWPNYCETVRKNIRIDIDGHEKTNEFSEKFLLLSKDDIEKYERKREKEKSPKEKEKVELQKRVDMSQKIFKLCKEKVELQKRVDILS